MRASVLSKKEHSGLLYISVMAKLNEGAITAK